jgi:protein kinase X
VPRVNFEGDTRNFDEYPEQDLKEAPSVSEADQRLFEDF